VIQKIIQFWKEFHYKKTFIFGCFVVFVYFYDFTINSHGFSIENGSDQNITILEIINDDRRIVALREIYFEPKRSRQIGCDTVLSVSAYGGSTLQVTIKNTDNSVQTASCELDRPNGFFQRLYGDRYYTAVYDGSTQLTCKSFYVDSPMCGVDDDSHGLNKKTFQFKN